MSAVDELAELEKAATSAPWWTTEIGEADELGNKRACVMTDHTAITDGAADGELRSVDARLIVAMRNALPALLAVARAAERLSRARRYSIMVAFGGDSVSQRMGDVEYLGSLDALDAALAALGEAGK